MSRQNMPGFNAHHSLEAKAKVELETAPTQHIFMDMIITSLLNNKPVWNHLKRKCYIIDPAFKHYERFQCQLHKRNK